MSNELTRRAVLASGVGFAGTAGLAAAPANPAVRPKYFHMSQSTINYQAEFNAGKMDIFSFMDTCRALDLDGLDIHVSQLKSQVDRAYLKEVRRGCLNRGMPIASICVSTEFGRSAEAIPKELEKARVAMEAGMFLGAPILRTFVGSAPSPDKQNDAFRRGVEALRKTAEMGAGRRHAGFGVPFWKTFSSHCRRQHGALEGGAHVAVNQLVEPGLAGRRFAVTVATQEHQGRNNDADFG